MSGVKRPGAQSAAKRLLHELATYREEGNPALLELGPTSEHELTRWSAVMKGPAGSAYEGETPASRPGGTPPSASPRRAPPSFRHPTCVRACRAFG